MRYAIYSRKSRFTGKGESVENQVQLCREYIDFHYRNDPERHIEVFEDEGFSGKNTKRPEFQRLMAAIPQRRFDVVACYRLDRISRSVSDFSITYARLRKYGVSFVSVSENFDTSSSLGEAMMYISSIFSQLERNTIAERIRDNMLLLARSGRWLGGVTPLGFRSEQVRKETIDGRARTSYRLAPVEEELAVVRTLYEKYLATGALTQVETWCLHRDIRTRRGKPFTATAIREILANPVYCVADSAARAHFCAQGSSVCGEPADFDGRFGIAAYNRTSGDSDNQKKQPISAWIVAVGRHRGIVPSGDWLRAQRLLAGNRRLSRVYKPQNPVALLSGLLYCKSCGSAMRPRVNSNKSRDESDEQAFAYLCELKRKSKKSRCDCPNLPGNALDGMLCARILALGTGDPALGRGLATLRPGLESRHMEAREESRRLHGQIRELEAEISRLISVLAKAESDTALFTHTEALVRERDARIQQLRQALGELERSPLPTGSTDEQVDSVVLPLQSFEGVFRTAAIPDRRDFLRSLIERIEWDGSDVHVFLRSEPAALELPSMTNLAEKPKHGMQKC